jgi:hypothetical protein
MILHPELHGHYDRNDVIEFFGLNEPDIEWYNITEYNKEDNGRE